MSAARRTAVKNHQDRFGAPGGSYTRISVMRIQPVKRWVLWLLPLFALRSLVPIGFMLDANGSLVLCSGMQPAAVETGAHAAHAHHGGAAHAERSAHQQHSSAHQSSLCVFALAGGTGAPIPYVAMSLEASLADAPIVFVPDRELNSPPVRNDRIRGPPSV